MKKSILLTICAFMALSGTAFTMLYKSARPVTLTIFAYDGCGGCFGDGAPCQPCTVLDGLYIAYYEILEAEGLQGKINIYNTKEERGRRLLLEACENLGISEKGLPMPVVLLDGAYYAGESAAGEVVQALRARRPSAPPAPFEAFDGMVYFYSELCGECVRAHGYIDEALAALEDAGIALAEYNVDEEQHFSLLKEYMAGHGIGHESATVPYLFWEGEYFYGSDAIGAALSPWRSAG